MPLRLIIAFLATLTATPVWRDRINRIDSRSRMVPQVAVSTTPYSFCDSALVAGNRTGTWGCINGDGTTPTGDNLGPWVASGSPSSTSGTTCASPSYKTFDGANPDYYISTGSLGAVPSAFTLCGLYSLTSNVVFSPFAWEAGLGLGYTFVTEQSATLVMYPNGSGSLNTFRTVGTSDKILICYSSGSGAHHAYLKSVGGSTDGYVTGASSAPTLGAGAQKIIFGADSILYNLTGKFFGGFYTEKELSQSDMDAIYTATVTCP